MIRCITHTREAYGFISCSLYCTVYVLVVRLTDCVIDSVVHHSKLGPAYKIILGNSTQWQYYGTPGVGGDLKMIWFSSLIKAERVNVELWGYHETGK